MFSLLRRLYRDERGVTATEYALLIVFVALAIAGGAQVLGTDISDLLNKVATNISAAVVPTP